MSNENTDIADESAGPSERNQQHTHHEPADNPSVASEEVHTYDVNSAPPKKHKLTLKSGAVSLVLIVNLVLVGASTYLFLTPKKQVEASKSVPVTTSNVISPTKTASTEPGNMAAKTKHYVSKALGIEFDYPSEWRISSTPDNKSVDITSGKFSVEEADGSNSIGVLDINFDFSSNSTAFLPFSGDVIAVNSELLEYSNPTPQQRKQTYVSFGGFSGTTNNEFYDIFITGKVAFSQGEKVGSKPYKVDPKITAYINTCPDGGCHAFSTATITKATWDSDPNLLLLKNLFKSLKFT